MPRRLRDLAARAGRAVTGRAVAPLLGATASALTGAEHELSDAARAARFLRGRAAFRLREDDVFVASYPRSGTTWTVAIAYLVTSGARGLEFDHISDVAPWWERSLAYRLDAAERMAKLPGPRVFKTHLPRLWVPRGARCLYAARAPADVAVSYFHLYRRYLGYEGTFGAFFDRFLSGELQYGSYFRHVAGWERGRADPRVLIVPYEAMREAPHAWVRRIALFLGKPLPAARVDEIVALTDLRHMKQAEAKFDHVGELLRQWGVKDGAFIREGKIGAGVAALAPEQREALERAQAERPRWPELEWRLPAFLH